MEESMKDYAQLLEESYSLMGDGVHDTDSLLAWRKAAELKESQENITVTVSGIVKGGVVADFEGIRAFIPVSKLSLERIDDCNPFLGIRFHQNTPSCLIKSHRPPTVEAPAINHLIVSTPPLIERVMAVFSLDSRHNVFSLSSCLTFWRISSSI